jgi:hypothetical protein
MWTKLVRIVAVTAITIGLLSGCAIQNPPTNDTGELDVLVQNAKNEPLAGAKVVSNEQPSGQLKVTGITNSEGRAIYKDIKAGNYEFYVNHSDYEQKEFTVTVKGGKTTSITIVLNPIQS